MTLAVPQYVWASAHSLNNPDEAMKSALNELKKKAEAIPEIKKYFSNRLEIISRNDVQNDAAGLWFVTLTAKVVPSS